MMDEYEFAWYSNDYDNILGDSAYRLAGAELVPYGIYLNFNQQLLEMYLKYC